MARRPLRLPHALLQVRGRAGLATPHACRVCVQARASCALCASWSCGGAGPRAALCPASVMPLAGDVWTSSGPRLTRRRARPRPPRRQWEKQPRVPEPLKPPKKLPVAADSPAQRWGLRLRCLPAFFLSARPRQRDPRVRQDSCGCWVVPTREPKPAAAAERSRSPPAPPLYNLVKARWLRAFQSQGAGA
jgi:hypothetical protein